MTLTIEIPDDLASSWPQGFEGMARVVLEDFAVESYRRGQLSALQVRRLLGHDSRWETEDFLCTDNVWPNTSADAVAADGLALNALLNP